MKQMGSPPRADTNHFYNCLQQKRKHELNSSVVDGFEGEARTNCQQDGLCFYPGICCLALSSGFPVWSPRIYAHSLQVGAHCAEKPEAGLASVERTWQVWPGGRGNLSSPKLPLVEEALNEGALTLVGT